MKQAAMAIHVFGKAYYCKKHKIYLINVQALHLHFELEHRDEYEVLEKKGGKLLRDGKDPMDTFKEKLTELAGKETAEKMMTEIGKLRTNE
jgi:hypothetical protein